MSIIRGELICMQAELKRKPVAAAVPIVMPDAQRGYLFLCTRYSYILRLADNTMLAAKSFNSGNRLYYDWHELVHVDKVRALLP